MTLMELCIGTAASIGVGTPIVIGGIKSSSKPLIGIGATIIVAPVAYAGALIASAKLEEISKKKTSSSDEA